MDFSLQSTQAAIERIAATPRLSELGSYFPRGLAGVRRHPETDSFDLPGGVALVPIDAVVNAMYAGTKKKCVEWGNEGWTTAQIRHSIETDGFDAERAILVTLDPEDGALTIVDRGHTLLAAREAGLTLVPVRANENSTGRKQEKLKVDDDAEFRKLLGDFADYEI
jgi:hypothetical protein